MVRNRNVLPLKDELHFASEDLIGIQMDTIAIVTLIYKKFQEFFPFNWEEFVEKYSSLSEMRETFHRNWEYGFLADTLYAMDVNFYKYIEDSCENKLRALYAYYVFNIVCSKVLSGLVPQGWIEYAFAVDAKAYSKMISDTKKEYWYH